MNRTCKNCGESLEGRKVNANFCSDICRVRHYRLSKGIPDPFNPSAHMPIAKAKLHPFYYSYNLNCCHKPAYFHPSNNLFSIQCSSCGMLWEVFVTKNSR